MSTEKREKLKNAIDTITVGYNKIAETLMIKYIKRGISSITKDILKAYEYNGDYKNIYIGSMDIYDDEFNKLLKLAISIDFNSFIKDNTAEDVCKNIIARFNEIDDEDDDEESDSDSADEDFDDEEDEEEYLDKICKKYNLEKEYVKAAQYYCDRTNRSAKVLIDPTQTKSIYANYYDDCHFVYFSYILSEDYFIDNAKKGMACIGVDISYNSNKKILIPHELTNFVIERIIIAVQKALDENNIYYKINESHTHRKNKKITVQFVDKQEMIDNDDARKRKKNKKCNIS